MKKTLFLIAISLVLTACSSVKEKKPDEIKQDNTKHSSLDLLIQKDFYISEMVFYGGKYVVHYVSTNADIDNKISIVDSSTLEVLNEIPRPSEFAGGFDIITKDTGFYIEEGPEVIIYDYDLNIQEKINVAELMDFEMLGLIWGAPFAFSDDFKTIVYKDWKINSFVEYNLDTNDINIFSETNPRIELLTFSHMIYTDDYIGFFGQDMTREEEKIFGRLNTKTMEVDYDFIDDVSPKFHSESLLLVDNPKDPQYTGTGTTTLYNILENKTEVIDLISSDTSLNLSVLKSNLLISFNDFSVLGGKAIVYDNGKVLELKDFFPNDIDNVNAVYNSDTNSIVVYYSYWVGEELINEVKEIKL